MPAHKHAALMAEYAKDAMETETPWERWELNHRARWEQCQTSPSWCSDREYRRKPKTVTLNGIELPAPYRGEMKDGQTYYTSGNPSYKMFWDRAPLDKMCMEYGQLHLTQEAAQQWQDAIKKITSV
jgi:hypothetical protein